jgi:hypothetical protein
LNPLQATENPNGVAENAGQSIEVFGMMSSSPRPLPGWPTDASAHVTLLDVLIEIPLEKLFLLFQGGFNDFRKRLESMNGHSDYASTGWVVAPLPKEDPSPSERPVVSSMSVLKPNMVRKTVFRSGKYATSEQSKLLEVGPKRAVVEAHVETKAPYGDRFQVIVRTSYEANEKDKKVTRMTVKTAIVYTGSINGMIKGMIEKGSREGMEKGNRNAVELVKEIAKVTPTERFESGLSSQPGPSPRPVISTEHLETLFGKRLVTVLEPYAVLANEVVQQMHPSLASLTPTRMLVVCLTLVALQAVHLLLDVLTMLKSGSDRHSGGFMGYGLQLFFRIYRVPGSMHEVMCSFILLAIVRGALGIVSMALPDPRARAKGQDHGTTYRGYKSAIANAEPQYVGIDAKSEFALEQIGKGLDYFANKFRPAAAGTSRHHHHHRDKIKEKIRSYRNHKSKVIVHGGSSDRPLSAGSAAGAVERIHEDGNVVGTDSGEASMDSPSAHDSDSLVLPSMNETMQYSAPSLPPDRTVVEEIFECQRHQPFRGWGSRWPGHFLPTDLMNRWNVRRAKTNGIYTSQKLGDVVPDLPEGWEWVEDEWRVDLTGSASGTTDANGWSYALDFSRNVVFPFPPGSGKSKMSDFVRTRRWLRTRVLPPPRPDDQEALEDGEEASGVPGTSSNSAEGGDCGARRKQKSAEQRAAPDHGEVTSDTTKVPTPTR